MGDALLQKTYTVDFLTKKRVKNNGFVPQYYVENDHEAIIPKDIFLQVQAELVRRRIVHISPSGQRHSFSSNNCFAQITYCGVCGELYRRVHWNNRGHKSIVWRCISRLDPRGAEINCTNRTVNENLLKEITMKAMNHILSDSHTFLLQMQKNITKTIIKNDTLSPECIQKRLDELQQELIQHATNRQNYNAIANEIFRLREQQEEAEQNNLSQQANIKRLEDLKKFIREHPTQITEFNEITIRKIIEKYNGPVNSDQY